MNDDDFADYLDLIKIRPLLRIETREQLDAAINFIEAAHDSRDSVGKATYYDALEAIIGQGMSWVESKEWQGDMDG